MSTSRSITFALAALWVSAAYAAATPTPAEILEKADAIRNPAASYRMKVEIKSDGADPSAFEVALKGEDKTLIKTLAPARDKGRNLLMLGEDMWAYIPNLKRAVRVSLSQKLTGEAANGDISRMRWAGDYDAKLDSEDAKSWTLALTAKKKGLTYDKLKVTVEKGSFRPLTADYLTVSGGALKKAEFRAYKQLAGAERPSEILIRDATHQDRSSLIVVQEMEAKELKDADFHQDNLQ